MRSVLNISGIKCDNCDYKDASVDMKAYSAWLNKSCPVCGENLLTRDDYEMVKRVCLAVEIQNENIPANNTYAPRVVATLEMNGSGTITIKDLEFED